MSTGQKSADGVSAGGRGRLARVIAARGGLAAPEAPFVIEHREALIYMLREAAELEHGIMCQYLFAAFWLSRAALAQAQASPAGQQSPMSAAGIPPVWSWGAAGPPATSTLPDAGQDEAAVPPLSGPSQEVSFAAHIEPLFRLRDRQSMSFAFDLWSAEAVRARAKDTQPRLQDGSMPCDGSWPTAKIEVSRRWMDTGMQP